MIKIKKFFMLGCLVLCLSLVACSNVITEGEVYDKEYRDSEVMVIPMTKGI